MKFLKRNIKFIVIFVIGMIIVSMVSVYAAYSYLAQDVSYTKSDGTEISVKEALDQLYEKENSETTADYTGYYADVNDDGTVDGVIFIDLAQGASGQWGDSNGTYSYSATSNLRNYKRSTKVSSYTGKFGTKQVIAPNGTSGNARFYVMALYDYDSNFHYWRDACSSITQTVGSVTFRLPSKTEWSAFGGQLVITSSNYSSTYGLNQCYWSSTAGANSYAWHADFGRWCMYNYGCDGSYWVRLCATF